MFFEKLELKILDKYPQAIRLQGVLKKRTETIQEFLIKFITKWNNEKNTLYVGTTTIQTDTGRRRSLGDIFMILRYYYPDVTIEEVLKLLYLDWTEFGETGFRSSYCSTINKRVWYYEEEDSSHIYGLSNNIDEYGIKGDEYINALNNLLDN